MKWPVRSRLQEALIAYADALEGYLRSGVGRLSGRSFLDDKKYYQPLKAVEYEPREEDAIRESASLPYRENGERYGAWPERNEERMETKAKPRPVSELLDRGGCVILGDPGAGKSELLRWRTFLRLRDFRASTEPGGAGSARLPVFLSLSRMAGRTEESLEKFAERRLGVEVGDEETELPRLSVLAGMEGMLRDELGLGEWSVQLILNYFWVAWFSGRSNPELLLDGWDEVAAGDGRSRLEPWLGKLVGNYGAVVSSRIVGYSRLSAQSEEWRLLPLALDEAQSLVLAHVAEPGKAGGLCRELETKPQVAMLASNPLSLALIIRVFGDRDPIDLPRKKTELYRQVLYDLLGEPEAARKGRDPYVWEGTREAKLRFLEHLAWFGYPKVGRSEGEFDRASDRAWPSEAEAPRKLLKELGCKKNDAGFRNELEDCLKRDHGLLVRYGAGEVAVVHKALLDYLAASYLARAINACGFDGAVDVLEGGEELRVSASRYIDRKAWSPAHAEMIGLLGGLVEDTEGLLKRVRKEGGDDVMGHRLALAVRAAGEAAKGGAALGGSFSDLYEAGWDYEDIYGKTQDGLLISLAEMASGIEGSSVWSSLMPFFRDKKQCEITILRDFLVSLDKGIAADLLERLLDLFEQEADTLVRSRLVDAFEVLSVSIDGIAAAEMTARLADLLESKGDMTFRFRSQLVRILVRITSSLDGRAAVELSARLVALLKPEGDNMFRFRFAEALGAVADSLGGDAAIELTARLVALLESDESLIARAGLAEALGWVMPSLDGCAVAEISVRFLGMLESEDSPVARAGLAYALGGVARSLEGNVADELSNRLIVLLESEESPVARACLAYALGEVATSLEGIAAAELSARLVFLLESEESAVVRACLANALIWVATSLEGIAAAELSGRLIVLLESKESTVARACLAYALLGVAPSLEGTASDELSGGLVAFLESRDHPTLNAGLADALAELAGYLDGDFYEATTLAGRLWLFVNSDEESEEERVQLILADVLKVLADSLRGGAVAELSTGLVALLKSECDNRFRFSLAGALGEVAGSLGGDAAIEFSAGLVALLESDQYPNARNALAFALSSVVDSLEGDAAAGLSARLVALLESEGIPSVRRIFAKILGSVAGSLEEDWAAELAERLVALLETVGSPDESPHLAAALREIAGSLDEDAATELTGRLVALLETVGSSVESAHLAAVLSEIGGPMEEDAAAGLASRLLERIHQVEKSKFIQRDEVKMLRAICDRPSEKGVAGRPRRIFRSGREGSNSRVHIILVEDLARIADDPEFTCR